LALAQLPSADALKAQAGAAGASATGQAKALGKQGVTKAAAKAPAAAKPAVKEHGDAAVVKGVDAAAAKLGPKQPAVKSPPATATPVPPPAPPVK
jgi:hypothetical protein